MNLPEKVQIVEVGPRDGFQNIKTFIETKHKLEIIDSLEEAGCNKIESGIRTGIALGVTCQ